MISLSRLAVRWALAVPIAAALLPAPAAFARPLAEIQASGTLILCTNPNALPFSKKDGAEPGVHVELSKALTEALGLALKIEWAGPKRRMRDVKCDLFPGSRTDPALHEATMKLSRPYARASVVMGFARGVEPVADFRALSRDLKVGAIINSAPTVAFGKVGIRYAPYTYQEDLLDDLAKGELKAAALPDDLLAYYRARHPEAGLGAAAAFGSDPDLNWTLSLGLPKADQALADAVDAVLARWLEDDTVAKIYAKYGLELRKP